MSTPPPSGARRPYWALFAALGLLLLPAGTADLILGAAALAMAAVSLTRAVMRHHARAATAAPHENAVILGADASGRVVALGDGQLSAHGLILGASGAGKSTTLLRILTDHVRRGRSVVAIDLKGSPEFAATLRTAAEAAGRPFRVWTPDGPSRWNPLAYGNATELKDKLIATERFTEPHYQRAAERYVQLALQAIQELRPDQAPTLREVVSVLEPQRFAALARRLPQERAADILDYLATLTPDQHSAVRGLSNRLAIISESHTGEFLEPRPSVPGIDLRAALDGEEVVVFSLNSSVYGKLSAQLGTLAVQDLVAAAGHRLRQGEARRAPPALIGVDEFSALGADNLISLLARGRGSQVSVLLATQELADLDRAAPGLRDQVLGVTAVKIAHRQEVPHSAQTIAQMAGTKTVWENTFQIRPGPFGRYDTSRGTRREVERFVVHPNEIKSLRTGQAVVITKLPRPQVRTVRVTPPARDRGGPEL